MLTRFLALLLLLLSLPIFCIVSFSVFLYSGRPIFYLHNRYGYKFKKFNMIKFRTMHNNDGPDLTNYQDTRITKIGEYLRKYKLDEIPQLVNIIKGDMAFIGPRPESIEIVNQYKKYFDYLYYVKPGISGISSIIFKNEEIFFKKININIYADKILPIKSHLTSLFLKKHSLMYDGSLFLISIISIINHNWSLYLLDILFLSKLNIEFRTKLNKLFSKHFL